MAYIDFKAWTYSTVTMTLNGLDTTVNYERKIVWLIQTTIEDAQTYTMYVPSGAEESDWHTFSDLNPGTTYDVIARVYNNSTGVLVNNSLVGTITTLKSDITVDNVTEDSAEIIISGTDYSWKGYRFNFYLNGEQWYSEENWQYEDPCIFKIIGLKPNTSYRIKVDIFKMDGDIYLKTIDLGEGKRFTTDDVELFSFTYAGANLENGKLVPVLGNTKNGSLYFYLTRTEWNDLCKKINKLRVMYGEDKLDLEVTDNDVYFKAGMYNNAKWALYFFNKELPEKDQLDYISAKLLNDLKDTVNAAIEDYYQKN